MNSALIIGVVFGILGIALVVLLPIVAIVFIIALFRGWNKQSGERRANAEAQRQRHGGQTVLEWSWPRAPGAPDAEFGDLLEEFPKKGGPQGGHPELCRTLAVPERNVSSHPAHP